MFRWNNLFFLLFLRFLSSPQASLQFLLFFIPISPPSLLLWVVFFICFYLPQLSSSSSSTCCFPLFHPPLLLDLLLSSTSSSLLLSHLLLFLPHLLPLAVTHLSSSRRQQSSAYCLTYDIIQRGLWERKIWELHLLKTAQNYFSFKNKRYLYSTVYDASY